MAGEEVHLSANDHDLLIELRTQLGYISTTVEKTSRDLQTKAEMKDYHTIETNIASLKAEFKQTVKDQIVEVKTEMRKQIEIMVNPLVTTNGELDRRLTKVERFNERLQRYIWMALGVIGFVTLSLKAIEYISNFMKN